MKKMKLITSLSSLGVIACVAPIVATSCSQSQDFKAIKYFDAIIYGEGKKTLEPFPVIANTSWEVEAKDFEVILSDDSIKTPDKISAVSKNTNYIKIANATDTTFDVEGISKTPENEPVDIDITVEYQGQKGTATVQFEVEAPKPYIGVSIDEHETFGGLGEIPTDVEVVKLIDDIEDNEYLSLTAINFTNARTPEWTLFDSEGIVDGAGTKYKFTPSQNYNAEFKVLDASIFQPGENYSITAIAGLETASFMFTTAYSYDVTGEEWAEGDNEWKPADWESTLDIQVYGPTTAFKKEYLSAICVEEEGEEPTEILISDTAPTTKAKKGALWLDISNAAAGIVTLKYQAAPSAGDDLENGFVAIKYKDNNSECTVSFDIIPPNN